MSKSKIEENRSEIAKLVAMFKKEEEPNVQRFPVIPVHTLPDGGKMDLHILIDKNENNPLMFTQEIKQHHIRVNGVVASMPCRGQFLDEDGVVEVCPICVEAQVQYKLGRPDLGKELYAKKRNLVNAYVVSDDTPANPETGENNEGKVGVVNFSYQLFAAFKSAITSGDMEMDDIIDGKDGYPFTIKRVESGGYSNYSTSGFGRRKLKLSAAVIAKCDEERIDLRDRLPECPSLEKMNTTLEAWRVGQTEPQVDQDIVDDIEPAKGTRTVEEAQKVLSSIRSRKSKSQE